MSLNVSVCGKTKQQNLSRTTHVAHSAFHILLHRTSQCIAEMNRNCCLSVPVWLFLNRFYSLWLCR